MRALSQLLHYCAEALEAWLKAASALARLQHGLEVVQHQETARSPRQIQQSLEAARLAVWRWRIARRQEPDRSRQPLAGGKRIAQTAPVHVVEGRRQIEGQTRRQERFANAAQPDYRHHPTALVEYPAPQHLALRVATQKARHVGCLAPVLATRSIRVLDVLLWRRHPAARREQQLTEPRGVKRRLEVGRLARDRLPQRLGFGQLVPHCKAARLEKRGDQRAQARRAGIGQAALPALDGAHVHTRPPRKRSLAQTCPAAVLQRQSSEALGFHAQHSPHGV